MKRNMLVVDVSRYLNGVVRHSTGVLLSEALLSSAGNSGHCYKFKNRLYTLQKLIYVAIKVMGLPSTSQG